MEGTTAVAVAESAKATGKFMDILQKFFKPILTKKQVDADIYAIDKLMEAEKKHPDIDFLYQDGRIITRKLTSEELLERVQRRKLIESLKQEHNLETVISITANELKNSNTSVSDTPVDEDWLIRFFHIIENVSSGEMQLIWGKILSGEVIQPGRFSLRTLDTIRNVSRNEAEIFQKIIPLAMKFLNHVFITNDENILRKNDIYCEMILRLSECGLINSNSMLSLNFTVTSSVEEQILNDKSLIKISGKDTEPFKLSHGVYTLTNAGKELYTVLTHECNEKYVCDLAEKIYTDSKDKVLVSVHNIVGSTGDGRNLYINQPPLRSFP